MNKDFYKIRIGTLEDSYDISELSNQLGYPSSKNETNDRLRSILSLTDHVIYVAYIVEGRVIGWIHAYKRQSVESGSFAEIGGFIVSKAFQGKGVGNQLLQSIEKWARQMKLPKLRVRSQIQRTDAKQFYSNRGFTVTKKQRVFDKAIENETYRDRTPHR